MSGWGALVFHCEPGKVASDEFTTEAQRHGEVMSGRYELVHRRRRRAAEDDEFAESRQRPLEPDAASANELESFRFSAASSPSAVNRIVDP